MRWKMGWWVLTVDSKADIAYLSDWVGLNLCLNRKVHKSTFTSTDKFQVFWADYLQVSIQCLVPQQWYSKLDSFYDVWVKCAFFLFLNTKPWNLCVRTLRLFINAISHGVLFRTLPLLTRRIEMWSQRKIRDRLALDIPTVSIWEMLFCLFWSDAS